VSSKNKKPLIYCAVINKSIVELCFILIVNIRKKWFDYFREGERRGGREHEAAA
jgi:hypothetical protein